MSDPVTPGVAQAVAAAVASTLHDRAEVALRMARNRILDAERHLENGNYDRLVGELLLIPVHASLADLMKAAAEAAYWKGLVEAPDKVGRAHRHVHDESDRDDDRDFDGDGGLTPGR